MANTEFIRALSDAGAKAHLCVPSEVADQWFTLPALGGATQGAAVALAAAGAGGDMVSPLINSENNLTAAGAALISTWNHCTATSANYALTLPAVASNYGKFLGVIIDPSSTYLVTVTGNGAENIDGQNTRIMWASEVAGLFADQASGQWIKVGGKSRPMSASLGASANQTFASAATTLLNYTTQIYNNAPAAFVTAATARITALRPSTYRVTFSAISNTTNATANAYALNLFKNGAQINWNSTYVPSVYYCGLVLTTDCNLVVNDYVQPYLNYSSGAYTTSVFYNDFATHSSNYFTVTEIPTW